MKKPNTPNLTHSQLCKSIADYMRTKHKDKLFIKITNEGNLEVMGKLKDEGLEAGVYDYFLAHVKMTYDAGALISVIPGLWIEAKKKGDILSKAQKTFREKAIAAHYSVLEVYDIDAFMKEIDEYCS